MADRDQYRSQLSALFQAELDCAARLDALLAAEANALASRDADAMEQVIADKHAVTREFEVLETQRKQLVSSSGFSDDPIGMDACIAWCDEGGEIAGHWQGLMSRISNCQHQNRINGAQVDANRRYVQQALSLLRGQAPQTSLYNATGANTSSGIPGRTLAKA